MSPRIGNPHDVHERDARRLVLLAEQFEKYTESLIPRSFLWVLAVLAWITLTGVTLPLLFLPGLPGDWSKGVLLSAFLLGVVGLIMAFGGQFRQLQRMGHLKWLAPGEYTQA
jgi:drug/metabolite transporter (DMT)-like permease